MKDPKDKFPGVVQCLSCKLILVSNYRHDYQSCGCPQGTFVDGGYDYLRAGGKRMDQLRVLRLSVARSEKK